MRPFRTARHRSANRSGASVIPSPPDQSPTSWAVLPHLDPSETKFPCGTGPPVSKKTALLFEQDKPAALIPTSRTTVSRFPDVSHIPAGAESRPVSEACPCTGQQTAVFSGTVALPLPPPPALAFAALSLKSTLQPWLHISSTESNLSATHKPFYGLFVLPPRLGNLRFLQVKLYARSFECPPSAVLLPVPSTQLVTAHSFTQ